VEKVLKELKALNTPPIKLYYYNKPAISIAYNLVLHDKTKHAEVDKHFIG